MEAENRSPMAPVLLRGALAVVFFAHGLPKLVRTMAAAGFFAQLGIPYPAVAVFIVGLIEVIGSLFLLLGVAVRVAATALALVMVAAMGLAKSKVGFVNGWEFELVLMAAALSLVLSGPGVWAVGGRKLLKNR